MPFDRFDRFWDLPPAELCPDCGQPDNCGDCTHHKLSDEEYAQLSGNAAEDERIEALLAAQGILPPAAPAAAPRKI